MARNEPIVELDEPYSSRSATPTPWPEACAELDRAEVYWLSTVRPDGRPHVTPVAAVWMDGALHCSTGPEERKAKNLAQNPQIVIATGCNHFRRGLDIVIEGASERVTDESALQRLADLFATKYDGAFGFTVRDGSFFHDEGGVANVSRIAATKAFAYGRGAEYSATRYRFA